ncbi:unnamed protein product [Closterium sp. NIES-65]|nr:unnamed protein product [Closterium sp. NIES-65]
MGNPVKPQLVAVPLILFLVIGSCTAAAHPWRRALVRNDNAVSWNAAAAYTNSRTAPRGVNSKAATVEQRVSEPLVYSARGGAAGSHATPSWSQHTAASRVGTAAPHAVHYAATPDAASHATPHAVHYAATPDAASHAAPHAVHYAATTDAASHAAPHAVHYAATTRGAPHAARNAVNHGSHGPGNANLPAAANQHRGGVSRHDGNGGGTIAVNGAFRAASANDVAIHHRSSHERHTRDERSSGGPVGWHIQPSSSGGFTGGVLAPPLWSLPRDRPRWPFHKAGASDVAFHRRNGGGNSNARGANHPGSYQRDDDLAWDDGVAATAQEWANELASKGCPLEHGGAEGLGQNLYWLSPAGLTPQEDRGAVQSWVEEKADWTPSPIPDGCADGKMCGHYTQVVWRDTTHVGCASAQCPDGSGMWVCNYSPPGNFAGQTPF